METRASYVVVGAFVFGLLAAVLGFVVWLGKLELDHQANAYRIGFSGTVTGLSVGSPVRYRGIPVGQVTGITLDAEDVETAIAEIERDIKTRHPEVSRIFIEAQDWAAHRRERRMEEAGG